MAALPPKVVELQDVVLPLVGLTNAGSTPQCQTAQFLALHGLNSSVNDFNLIEPHQAKDMVKAASARHPAQAMGILIQNNLTGLIWYVKDRTRRGLPVDADNIVLDNLHHGHMAYKAYVQNRTRVKILRPSRSGATSTTLTIGIARLLRPYPLCMGAITALLHTSFGLTSRRGGTLQSTL
jgi:hypothetical protein